MAAMSKTEAILALLRDRGNSRVSTTSARRVVNALRTLGLDDSEIRHMMYVLEYAKNDQGEPWNPNIERVWP